jgi:hypothetical protein
VGFTFSPNEGDKMNSRAKIDSNWLSSLAEEFPQSADQIGALAKHLLDKQECLARLIRFCAARPELPMMRMYAEYGAALDAVALEPPRGEAEPELTDEEAAELEPRERAARTKRLRTRTRAIGTAVKLILEGSPWKIEQLAEKAGVGAATIHTHFSTRSRVIVAAYDELLSER